ncbi:hypothetical protein [Hyunsoonleella rubra]|uniref:Cytochrome b561 bacterial/Ni-hydrogenase domain-containing protein n=1 Tax=Hyunsoonleella rubra TaxID=1737062 RepID=A0ABW5TAV7_9FLAO
MVISINKSTLIGLVLLTGFFLQFFLNLEWGWLFEMQRGEMFKRWTGLVLALFITFQWVLTLTRTIKKWRLKAVVMQNIHKWLGALSPIVFYMHSATMGYGYLLMLSYIFLANTLLGYLNLDVIKSGNETFFKGWMITHVAASMVVTILMIFHITMVFYYK